MISQARTATILRSKFPCSIRRTMDNEQTNGGQNSAVVGIMNPISASDRLINVMETGSLVTCDAKQWFPCIDNNASFVRCLDRFPVTRIWWTVEQLTVRMNIAANATRIRNHGLRLCEIGPALRQYRYLETHNISIVRDWSFPRFRCSTMKCVVHSVTEWSHRRINNSKIESSWKNLIDSSLYFIF